jgi:cellulose synthase/poly-beta-1,6-N-acetylglucosamine synthase-like glycosyltransferase
VQLAAGRKPTGQIRTAPEPTALYIYIYIYIYIHIYIYIYIYMTRSAPSLFLLAVTVLVVIAGFPVAGPPTASPLEKFGAFLWCVALSSHLAPQLFLPTTTISASFVGKTWTLQTIQKLAIATPLQHRKTDPKFGDSSPLVQHHKTIQKLAIVAPFCNTIKHSTNWRS